MFRSRLGRMLSVVEKVRRSKWARFASLPFCRNKLPLWVVPSTGDKKKVAPCLFRFPATASFFAGACLAFNSSQGRNTVTYRSTTVRFHNISKIWTVIFLALLLSTIDAYFDKHSQRYKCIIAEEKSWEFRFLSNKVICILLRALKLWLF
jgi:hypothetical protein